MKKTLFAVALLSVYASHAQEKIIFLNEKAKAVKERQAVILEQHLKLNDTIWETNLYYINGPRSLSMQSTDEEGDDLNGRYITYDRKGFADTLGVYVHGRRDGPWLVMTPEIRVLCVFNYKDGEIISKKDSTQLNAENQKIIDSLSHGRAIVESESEFPGGQSGWLQYISSHLKYPDRALNYGVQGTAIITFTIGKDGHIDPIFSYLHKSVEYSIDKESIRLLATCPPWIPAVRDGMPIESFRKQPVTFSRK
jgi:hypothetical protein